MRKHYLDNIRWATVLLVAIYHVFYMFNGVGIFGGVPGAPNIPFFDTLAAVIYPWFMVLLFVIAGMSARYALGKRTAKEFIQERTRKLLVPATLGLFVIHWVTGYLEMKMGGGLPYIPKALVYPIAAISGIGPLWFIQMLYLFSLALVLLRKLDKRDALWRWCGRASAPVIVLLFLPIWGAAQILNLPVLTMYRFGIYFLAFLIGYYVFSHEEAQEKLGAMARPMAVLAVCGAVAYAFRYGGTNFTDAACLQSLFTNLYLWVVVLALLGCGKRYWNRGTRLSRYLAKASFGVYILHDPILVAVSYGLCTYCTFPAMVNYALALVLDILLTFGLYALIRRIPGIRWMVLGISRGRKNRDA